MILSTSFLSKVSVLLFAGVYCLSGCASNHVGVNEDLHPHEGKLTIAVFPIQNLSGTKAPRGIRESLINLLRMRGFDVLEDETLEKLMAQHRIRYAGGIDDAAAQAFGRETSAKGVLIASLELYSETNPPKIALISRLVSTGNNPAILWIDGVGLAGDDSPGILGIGLIENPKILLQKALQSLSDSLAGSLMMNKEKSGGEARKKFRPKIAYRSLGIDPGKNTELPSSLFSIKARGDMGGKSCNSNS